MQYIRELLCYMFGHGAVNVGMVIDTEPTGFSVLTKTCSYCGMTLETQTVRENCQ